MTGKFDKDMTALLEAPAPSLPRPTREQAPRVAAAPVPEHEIHATQLANLAAAIGQHLRQTGATVTLEGLAYELGEDAERLRPALELAVEQSAVIQTGATYTAFEAGRLGAWNRR